jgi:LacI family gluconate utilization system Gnt-I transcriptional repressor
MNKNNPPSRKRASSSTDARGRMEDVARLAGVSIITVSRVINQPDKVAAGTRARVEAAIARIGYVPNLTAGSLASSRSHVIGAIVPTIDNSIFAETIRGLSQTLAPRGYQLLLGQTGYEAQAEDDLVAAFLGRRVDGLVLTGVHHSALTRKRLVGAGVPVVETWDLTPSPIDMLAGFSNHAAGREMARHLLARGYRDLAVAGGADERSTARMAGFEEAVRETGDARLAALVLPSGTSFEGGRLGLGELLQRTPRPRAIFFSNDVLAVGALMECKRRGLRVPEDIAIAGFVDLDIAQAVEPGLTTVHVGSRQIGEEAASLLLARLDGEVVVNPVRDLGFRVVARASA